MGTRHAVFGAIGSLVVLVAVIGGVKHFRLFEHGTSTPLSLDETIERYQATATSVTSPTGATGGTVTALTSSTSSTGTTDPAATSNALPSDGVYVYTTTGHDAVDALTGDHHDYPATTTITVTASECGVQQRWDVLVERWEVWQRCVTGDGVLETRRTSYDQFFGRSQTDTWSCSGSARPLTFGSVERWASTCTSGGSTETHRGVVIGLETLTVGIENVETLHVSVDVSKASPGDRQVIDTWYQVGTDLVIAQESIAATTNPSPVGAVHYTENYSIHLTSLAPLT